MDINGISATESCGESTPVGGILPIKIGGIDLSSHGEFLRTLFHTKPNLLGGWKGGHDFEKRYLIRRKTMGDLCMVYC